MSTGKNINDKKKPKVIKMKLDDYMYDNNKMSAPQFAKACNVPLQTIYRILKGKNVTTHSIARVMAYTCGQVTFWELMPNDLQEEFDRYVQLRKAQEMENKFPTSDQQMENARKARWDSKFTGMCC
jgi:hypothetical protein